MKLSTMNIISVFLMLISFVSLINCISYRMVNVDWKPGKESKVYLVCPPVRNGEQVYIRKSGRLDSKDKYGQGIVVSVKSNEDLGDYFCVTLKDGKEERHAKIELVNKSVPEILKYESKDTVQYHGKIGDTIKMKCNVKKEGKFYWVKQPQFVIDTVQTLEIKSIGQHDYGSYYCYSGNSATKVVNGQKHTLLPVGAKIKEEPIDDNLDIMGSFKPKSSSIRYRPSVVAMKEDQVVWEQPPGNILLRHGRDLYISKYNAKEHSSQPFYYQITRSGSPLYKKTAKLMITKPEKDLEISIQGDVAYDKTLKLSCGSVTDLKPGEKIVWMKGDTIIANNSKELLIKKFSKENYGNYSCKKVSGNRVLSRSMLALNNINKKSGEAIEMTKEPGLLYQLHRNQQQELHCELIRSPNGRYFPAKDVVWTFKGAKIDFDPKGQFGKTNRFERFNSMTSSILILKEVDVDNEGIYKCFQGSKVLAANLVLEREQAKFKISPKRDRVQHNVGIPAEFHCRIDYPKTVKNTDIKWSFIPANSRTKEEVPLLPSMKVVNPKVTESTSFVQISNVMKKHEGWYVCNVIGKKLSAYLEVTKISKLIVTPKTITIKPGGTAGFACKVDDADGKVIWRRKDKKSLTANKELRIGGSTNAMLQIMNADKSFDGTQYECIYLNQKETVTLYVREDCPLNQRKCKSGKCIDEKLFCDGKDDCGDNSDEDVKRCNECNPNSIHCDFIKGIPNPKRRCIISHWKCDGVDDCGNNFDEMNCTVKNKDTCIGTHYNCSNSLIPRSYWCDGEADCAGGEDEVKCSQPVAIHPTKQTRYTIYEGNSVSIKCIMSGRPVPTITWRYNWGFLKEDMNKTITNEVTNCSLITSTLTIHNISNENSGIYTCEGISNKRVIPPDFVINVQPPSVCKTPFFNNDANSEILCLRCFCSNRTNTCSSVMGYKKSDEPIVYPHNSTLQIYDMANSLVVKNANSENFLDKSMSGYAVKSVELQNIANKYLFFGGDFGVTELWTQRYGFMMSYDLIVKINSTTPSSVAGPLLAIMNNKSATVYYCPPKSYLTVFPTTPKDFVNNEVKVSLWEKSYWYTNINCRYPASRIDFMKVITTPNKLLFRLNYFADDQQMVNIKNIKFEHAVPSKNDANSWVGRIEKCDCPPSTTGLSCEVERENT